MRKLIDFWSVPHFLFGVVSALVAVVFSVPAWPMFFTTLLLAVTWEFLEMGFRLREATWNVASDILLPLMAFFPTFLLASRPDIGAEHRVLLLVVASSVYVYTNIIAWEARIDGDDDFGS